MHHIWFGVYQICTAYLLGKFALKIQNCQFKLKFAAQTNSKMQNSIIVFTFLGKFGPKFQNCQFKLKFDTKTNSNIQNSMWCSLFLVSAGNIFLGKFGLKNQNCQFKLIFGTKANSNMQNSIVLFILPVFDWKFTFCFPFWANMVQKSKLFVELKFSTYLN